VSEKSGKKEEKMSVEEKLKIVYSDKDIIVRMAPNEEELKNILLELLDEKSMNLKELHAVLSGIASEDKIRKALARLAEKGLIVLQEDGRYARLGTS
jgi:predicted transcriptional regulator